MCAFFRFNANCILCVQPRVCSEHHQSYRYIITTHTDTHAISAPRVAKPHRHDNTPSVNHVLRSRTAIDRHRNRHDFIPGDPIHKYLQAVRVDVECSSVSDQRPAAITLATHSTSKYRHARLHDSSDVNPNAPARRIDTSPTLSPLIRWIIRGGLAEEDVVAAHEYSCDVQSKIPTIAASNRRECSIRVMGVQGPGWYLRGLRRVRGSV